MVVVNGIVKILKSDIFRLVMFVIDPSLFTYVADDGMTSEYVSSVPIVVVESLTKAFVELDDTIFHKICVQVLLVSDNALTCVLSI